MKTEKNLSSYTLVGGWASGLHTDAAMLQYNRKTTEESSLKVSRDGEPPIIINFK